jgi:PTH1 family peptidyl-tRNA hydrolase
LHLVVGLGNPGPRYRDTRHNVGFWVAEELARRWSVALKAAPPGLLGTGKVAGASAAILLPATFMNLSGEAVTWAMSRLDLEPGDLIVVHDDLDLDVGRIRVRPGGGDGGHLGMRAVLDAAGTDEVARVRVGIGRPPPEVDPRDHVLLRPLPDEAQALRAAAACAADAVETVIGSGIVRAMEVFNRPSQIPGAP